VGLPITLSVVAIAVGRRLGVHVDGIGLPGHFVIGDGSGNRFADPFNGGELHDAVSLSAAWQRITSSPTPATRSMLAATPARSIALRMLNNLARVFTRLDDPVALHTLARLRGAFAELDHEAAERSRWVRYFN
jgi:regulator of sirC expression with transglutaminase-like and TPR domain